MPYIVFGYSLKAKLSEKIKCLINSGMLAQRYLYTQKGENRLIRNRTDTKGRLTNIS